MKVYYFVSRNKDNKDISDFKQRSQVYLIDDSKFESNTQLGFITQIKEYIRPQFDKFVSEGQPNEFCRCYISINKRNQEKTKKALLTKLINEDINLSNLNSIVCSLAAKPENALEHKWLFDFDCLSASSLRDFLLSIRQYTPTRWYITPNGYAIVADHGFDTRNLLPEYVTLKRDADLCIMWGKNISHGSTKRNDGGK